MFQDEDDDDDEEEDDDEDDSVDPVKFFAVRFFLCSGIIVFVRYFFCCSDIFSFRPVFFRRSGNFSGTLQCYLIGLLFANLVTFKAFGDYFSAWVTESE